MITFAALIAAFGATALSAATATPADRAFVAKVSQGGMFEVAAGKLAEGEYDEAPPFIGKGVVEVAKDARLHIFSGLSHCSHIEDPSRVMAASSAFLRDHA